MLTSKMSKIYCEASSLSKEHINCGDEVYLSGVIYTARDAAHKKIVELIEVLPKLHPAQL